ncbi:hypothetical protein [uncultured Thiodictyon sp.]|uniref:hypothetical protein n=1 Tax=uncultured Thiodictyon sp. TaxID=1846217 RepID=UPI0025E5CC09|nr:hypothetical protein [uncultured Thiodictyon sp.]
MADDADRAQEMIERTLEEAIRVARGPGRSLRGTHCQDCGDALAPHRRPYGRCIECQERAEHRATRYPRAGDPRG